MEPAVAEVVAAAAAACAGAVLKVVGAGAAALLQLPLLRQTMTPPAYPLATHRAIYHLHSLPHPHPHPHPRRYCLSPAIEQKLPLDRMLNENQRSRLPRAG